MTNSNNTDVTFGGAWGNGVVAKEKDAYSTAPTDKYYSQPPLKAKLLKIVNSTSSDAIFKGIGCNIWCTSNRHEIEDSRIYVRLRQ